MSPSHVTCFTIVWVPGIPKYRDSNLRAQGDYGVCHDAGLLLLPFTCKLARGASQLSPSQSHCELRGTLEPSPSTKRPLSVHACEDHACASGVCDDCRRMLSFPEARDNSTLCIVWSSGQWLPNFATSVCAKPLRSPVASRAWSCHWNMSSHSSICCFREHPGRQLGRRGGYPVLLHAGLSHQSSVDTSAA